MRDARRASRSSSTPSLLRLLIGHVSRARDDPAMLEDYVDELERATGRPAEVREALRGADRPGELFRLPSLVADWGLDYFDDEGRHVRRALDASRTAPALKGARATQRARPTLPDRSAW